MKIYRSTIIKMRGTAFWIRRRKWWRKEKKPRHGKRAGGGAEARRRVMYNLHRILTSPKSISVFGPEQQLL
jgi:hypothetical protein